jgi:3-keto steroid reductase
VTGKIGRWRGMKVTGKEEREEFEVTGQAAWREMEALRVEWEGRLGGVDQAVSEDL